MRELLLLLIIVVFIISCKTMTKSESTEMSGNPQVAAWPNVVMYEIFVQSFADSNGDGIGDIKGLMGKLDYLQDLGIKGIWLMPVMPSPSYHKYDVTDYYGIHPDYGDIAVFKQFVKEAHQRDIKVVIDMIINHSSNLHPWFLDSKSGTEASKRDYYIWSDEKEIEQFSTLEKKATGDSGNLLQWHKDSGNTHKYYGFFTGMMPDLNYDNPEVRDEVMGIGKFWIEEIGVDGFRLDAAKHIYEDSRVKDNQDWWKMYRKALESIKPDIYLVGEVWDKADVVAPFLHGLPSLFNFDLAFSMLESIKREKSVTAFISAHAWETDETTAFEAGYLKNQQTYQEQTHDFQDAIFLGNHDQNRILSALKGDVRKGKLAASILLTMPGTPYLYYGEEIGMLGMKPDPNIREPFLWNKAKRDSDRTDWIRPEFSRDSTVRPLSVQKKDAHSLYHHYKALINLRNTSQGLCYGDFIPANYGDGAVISYYRNSDIENVLIVHNLSGHAITIKLKEEDTDYKTTRFSTYGEKITDHKIDLKAFSSIVLKQEK